MSVYNINTPLCLSSFAAVALYTSVTSRISKQPISALFQNLRFRCWAKSYHILSTPQWEGPVFGRINFWYRRKHSLSVNPFWPSHHFGNHGKRHLPNTTNSAGGVVTGHGPRFDSRTGFFEWEYKLESSTVNRVYLTNKGGKIIALI
jgi:hypothetical protein